jgi:hypothetical protein
MSAVPFRCAGVLGRSADRVEVLQSGGKDLLGPTHLERVLSGTSRRGESSMVRNDTGNHDESKGSFHWVRRVSEHPPGSRGEKLQMELVVFHTPTALSLMRSESVLEDVTSVG